MPSGAGTGRPPGARGSAGRPPAAAPADTKRDECAPPSAKARLSKTCARRARARARALPPAAPGACGEPTLAGAGRAAWFDFQICTQLGPGGQCATPCGQLYGPPTRLASWQSSAARARALDGRASCTSDGLSADSGPSTKQRCSLKWPSSAFHSGCLLSTCARGRALAASSLPPPSCHAPLPWPQGSSAAAQTLAQIDAAAGQGRTRDGLGGCAADRIRRRRRSAGRALGLPRMMSPNLARVSATFKRRGSLRKPMPCARAPAGHSDRRTPPEARAPRRARAPAGTACQSMGDARMTGTALWRMLLQESSFSNADRTHWVRAGRRRRARPRPRRAAGRGAARRRAWCSLERTQERRMMSFSRPWNASTLLTSTCAPARARAAARTTQGGRMAALLCMSCFDVHVIT